MLCRLIFTIIVLSMVGLAGCTSKPDDSAGIEHIKKYYEENSGHYKPKNIVRINGWEEGDSNYKVEYSYDIIAEKSYDDVLIASLEKTEEDSSTLFPTGLAGLNITLTVIVALTDGSNDNSFQKIARVNLQNDAEGARTLEVGKRIQGGKISSAAKAYFKAKENLPDFEKARNLLTAMYEVESDGFKPEGKKGDVLSNENWTLEFLKTENGWKVK